MAEQEAERIELLASDVRSNLTGSLWSKILLSAQGVIFRLRNWIQPALLTAVKIDDNDSTRLCVSILNASQVGASRNALLVGDKYSTTTINTANTGAGASATIVAANENRKYLCLINDSAATVYLNFGAAAENGKGIRLNSGGGSYEMSAAFGNLHLGAVNGYAAAASAICYLEGTGD